MNNQKDNQEILNAIMKKVDQNKLNCKKAFEIVEELNVPAILVGDIADSNNIKLHGCQLGLFGYKPDKKPVHPSEYVSLELEDEIKRHTVNNRIPCLSVWDIAQETGLSKIEVCCACEKLSIKIKPCQLGAF